MVYQAPRHQAIGDLQITVSPEGRRTVAWVSFPSKNIHLAREGTRGWKITSLGLKAAGGSPLVLETTSDGSPILIWQAYSGIWLYRVGSPGPVLIRPRDAADGLIDQLHGYCNSFGQITLYWQEDLREGKSQLMRCHLSPAGVPEEPVVLSTFIGGQHPGRRNVIADIGERNRDGVQSVLWHNRRNNFSQLRVIDDSRAVFDQVTCQEPLLSAKMHLIGPGGPHVIYRKRGDDRLYYGRGLGDDWALGISDAEIEPFAFSSRGQNELFWFRKRGKKVEICRSADLTGLPGTTSPRVIGILPEGRIDQIQVIKAGSKTIFAWRSHDRGRLTYQVAEFAGNQIGAPIELGMGSIRSETPQLLFGLDGRFHTAWTIAEQGSTKEMTSKLLLASR